MLTVSGRTVKLTADAYKALVAAKEEGESFSSVVRRLTGTQVRLTEFAGAWKDASKARAASLGRYLIQAERVSAKDLQSLSSVGWKTRHRKSR